VKRTLVSSGSPYEDIIGFSRAVRVGSVVAVGGTAAIGDEGATVGVGDAGAQTVRIMEIIDDALRRAGASLDDVVRTRTMLVDVADWEAVATARAPFLKHVRPVDSIVEVSGFVNPEWLVEIEVDAVIT